MDPADRNELERMLHAEVQGLVDRQERLDGQAKDILVLSVRFDRVDPYNYGEAHPWLIVDMSDGYVPRDESYRRGARHISGRLEESMSAIQMMVEDHLREAVSIMGVDIRVEGRDIYYYFPDDLPPERLAPAR